VDVGPKSEAEELQEFRDLAESAGASVLCLITGSRRQPDPRLFVGEGKAEEIRDAVATQGADLAIFDHALSPSQERNLERFLSCRVVDRTGLILDIFAQRARSFEGKLQVELAQLRHLATRLVRGWTHLERQKGGIGLRGPGETQLETDRRLLGNRIAHLQKRLDKVDQHRVHGRKTRSKVDVATVSLVGYTNAGKSTLFNRLTSAGVFAADQLFATLDPTLRKLELPDNSSVVLADTVGFVRNLPHDLVAAFRSTLQETAQARLILHVIDAADPNRLVRIGQVNEVLTEIHAEGVPQIQIYNKIDLLDDVEPRLERDADGHVRRVWLSSKTGAGLELLLGGLSEYFGRDRVMVRIRLGPAEGGLRAHLFRVGKVLAEKVDEQGEWLIDVELPSGDYHRLLKQDERMRERLIA